MLIAFDRRGWGRRGGLKPAAHTPRVPGGEWHDLATHLHATAAKAKARADKFGAGDLAYLAGLIHDYGKFNPAFQKYLRDAVAGRSAKSVQHAVHGALLARDSGVPWVMQPIYGHHSQMPSGNDIKEAFANPETLQAYEKVRIAAEASGWKFNPPSSLDHPDFDLRGEMLLRMVFSCLVDSDYIDTEKHFDPERSKARTLGPSPSVLLPVLLASQEKIMLGKTGTVNEARREVYKYSLEVAKMERGVFRLSAPTGAGKTRSAMIFGLMHVVEHNLDRVIFAVPYLSITDQTASVPGVYSGTRPC